MQGGFWLVIAASIGWLTWRIVTEPQRVSAIRHRRDHRGLWLAAFEPQDRKRVDALLTTLCHAFLIPPAWRFRLRPSDDLHDLYRRNRRGQVGDSLEHVFLMRGLETLGAGSAVQACLARPCRVGALVRRVAPPGRRRPPNESPPPGCRPGLEPG